MGVTGRIRYDSRTLTRIADNYVLEEVRIRHPPTVRRWGPERGWERGKVNSKWEVMRHQSRTRADNLCLITRRSHDNDVICYNQPPSREMLEHNAVFAGVFASLASVFSKLALEDDAKTLKFLFQDKLSENSKISNYLSNNTVFIHIYQCFIY